MIKKKLLAYQAHSCPRYKVVQVQKGDQCEIRVMEKGLFLWEVRCRISANQEHDPVDFLRGACRMFSLTLTEQGRKFILGGSYSGFAKV